MSNEFLLYVLLGGIFLDIICTLLVMLQLHQIDDFNLLRDGVIVSMLNNIEMKLGIGDDKSDEKTELIDELLEDVETRFDMGDDDEGL